MKRIKAEDSLVVATHISNSIIDRFGDHLVNQDLKKRIPPRVISYVNNINTVITKQQITKPDNKSKPDT